MCKNAQAETNPKSVAAICGAVQGVRTTRSALATAEVREDLAGCVLAGAAGDAAAGVGARAAQVQADDREAVAGVAEQRPPEVELIEAGLTVERVTAGQPETRFEIDRGQDLAVDDELADSRGTCFALGDDSLPISLALRIPGPTPERKLAFIFEDAPPDDQCTR